MDWISDLLDEMPQFSIHKDHLEKFASEHAATKAENEILRPENAVLKTENTSLKAQMQTQQDKYEQLSTDFRYLAHASSRNTWRNGGIIGGLLFLVSRFGDITGGVEALGQSGRFLYTNRQLIASYVPLPSKYPSPSSTQQHQHEKWLIVSSAGIQVNSIMSSSGLT